MAPGDVKTRGGIELLASDLGVVDGTDGFLLLRKGGANKTIPDAFYDFARQRAASDSVNASGPCDRIFSEFFGATHRRLAVLARNENRQRSAMGARF